MNLPTYSYSDIEAFWECPRRWAWQRVGWTAGHISKPMLRGSLVHAAIAAYFRGEDIRLTSVAEFEAETADVPDVSLDEYKPLVAEALDLAPRYIRGLGATVEPLRVETQLVLLLEARPVALSGRPDYVGHLNGVLTLGDLKTSDFPDVRALDNAGQVDYYAWLWNAVHPATPVRRVAIDVITPEYVTRHIRVPRLDQGAYMAHALANLYARETLAEESPHYGRRCGYCPVAEACRMKDAGGDALAALQANNILRPPRWLVEAGADIAETPEAESASPFVTI